MLFMRMYHYFMNHSVMQKLHIKPLTEDLLRKSALRHIERYSCSTLDLKRVLERKVRRHNLEALSEDSQKMVETILDSFQKKGLLNDKTFAENRLASLLRQGKSLSKIASDLQYHGLNKAMIKEIISYYQSYTESDGDALDYLSALKLAKRRKIGPWRSADIQVEKRRNDIAVMARQGFSPDIIKKVFQYNPDEDL